MVKSSILMALLLGVIFAQMIPAHSSQSDDEGSGSDADSSNENESEDESDTESPALTCLLFDNLGCNTECSTIASAFSIIGTGKCSDDYLCECSLEQDSSLEGLFRAKFKKAEPALEKIKKDKKLAAKVLEILQIPFQTIDQTKRQLRKVVYPAIYDYLLINDETPAWELGMVDETDKLNYDKIKEYVAEKLNPVLKSSTKQLKSIDYKSQLNKSLKNKTDQDLQSIVNEVRRTNNKKLSDIVDDYLKSNKIKEKKNTEKDDIADAMGYLIIDQFVNYIDQQNKPIAKKPSRKPSAKSAAGKKPQTRSKTPRKQETAEKSKKPPSKGNTKKKTDKSSVSRFELPDFDPNFKEDYGGSIDETFKTKEYNVHYTKSTGGSIQFTWKKGTDQVEMSISSGGSVSQNWRLGDAKIKLDLSSGGSMSQTWDFGTTKYTYSKSSAGSWSKKWERGKKDMDALETHKKLIADWCDKNYFFVDKREHCTIFD